MRGDAPSTISLFLDLIFLAAIIPVMAFVINFVISGLGPYDFTTWELVDHFIFQVDKLFLFASDFIQTFFIASVIFVFGVFLFYEVSKMGGAS